MLLFCASRSRAGGALERRRSPQRRAAPGLSPPLGRTLCPQPAGHRPQLRIAHRVSAARGGERGRGAGAPCPAGSIHARAGDLGYLEPPVSRASPPSLEPPTTSPAAPGWRAPQLRSPVLGLCIGHQRARSRRVKSPTCASHLRPAPGPGCSSASWLPPPVCALGAGGKDSGGGRSQGGVAVQDLRGQRHRGRALVMGSHPGVENCPEFAEKDYRFFSVVNSFLHF